MVAAALEALVGGEPTDEAVEAALATIPADELEPALRWLAREHGAAALPILRRCLENRPDRAVAAAQALGTLPQAEAAEALETAETRTTAKIVRTAARRALYRLRQAGIDRRPRARQNRTRMGSVLRRVLSQFPRGFLARPLRLRRGRTDFIRHHSHHLASIIAAARVLGLRKGVSQNSA